MQLTVHEHVTAALLIGAGAIRGVTSAFSSESDSVRTCQPINLVLKGPIPVCSCVEHASSEFQPATAEGLQDLEERRFFFDSE